VFLKNLKKNTVMYYNLHWAVGYNLIWSYRALGRLRITIGCRFSLRAKTTYYIYNKKYKYLINVVILLNTNDTYSKVNSYTCSLSAIQLYL